MGATRTTQLGSVWGAGLQSDRVASQGVTVRDVI